MNKPEWFPFYVHKFLASANVGRMSAAARGAYIMLLCVAWHEEPMGTLPDDDKALADYARMKPAEWSKARESVMRAFEKSGDRWSQPTMVREAEKAMNKLAAASRAGKASANARSTTVQSIYDQAVNGRSTDVERSLNDRATARVGVGVGVSSSGENTEKTTPTPTAAVERSFNDRCPTLTPEQAAVYRAIVDRPLWLDKRHGWLDEVTARDLAVLPSSSIAFVEHTRASIRKRAASLTNPAGVFVKEIRRADPGLIASLSGANNP